MAITENNTLCQMKCHLSIPFITLPEVVNNTVMNTTKQGKLLQVFFTQFPMHRLLKLVSPTSDVLQAYMHVRKSRTFNTQRDFQYCMFFQLRNITSTSRKTIQYKHYEPVTPTHKDHTPNLSIVYFQSKYPPVISSPV